MAWCPMRVSVGTRNATLDAISTVVLREGGEEGRMLGFAETLLGCCSANRSHRVAKYAAEGCVLKQR